MRVDKKVGRGVGEWVGERGGAGGVGGWLARGGSVTTGPRVPRAEHAGASRFKCLHLAKSSPPPIASS